MLKELADIVQEIDYVQGIPLEMYSLFDQNINNLILLDHMIDEATLDFTLFTRGRHDKLPVTYLTQNLFHKNQREISLNSDYMAIFLIQEVKPSLQT